MSEDSRARRHHKKEKHNNYSTKEGRSDPRPKGKEHVLSMWKRK